jgi:hypothetical protein
MRPAVSEQAAVTVGRDAIRRRRKAARRQYQIAIEQIQTRSAERRIAPASAATFGGSQSP